MNLICYTDGACHVSTRKGGIGVVWISDGKIIKTYNKGFNDVTNNIMELMAINAVLLSIKKPINSLEIISDSEYAIGCISKPWNPKKNIALIKKIRKQLNETQKLINNPIKFTHIRGHAGNRFNELCDTLAKSASDE